MAMQDWKSVYSRIFWKNKREGGTPLNEANLNTSDIALKEIDNRILELRDAKFGKAEANVLIKDWNIDEKTGIITVTWLNNTTKVYDLNIEKIPVSFGMSNDGIITMTTADGTEFKTDLKKAIPIYTFKGSATIKVTPSIGESGDKVYTFDIVDGSIDGTKLNPDYLAEINTSVNNAELSEQKSLEYSLLSKEYAEQSKASEVKSKEYMEKAFSGTPSGYSALVDNVNELNESLSVIGKCKNLLNPTFDTYTHNGITFTRNDDGTYSLSGSRTDTSSSAYVTFIIDYPLEKGRYKLTGALDENNNIRCLIKESGSANKNIYDDGKGAVLDISKPNTTITLMIISIDDTSQTRIIKPMLTTDLSATYDDFVPYTGDGETLTHDVAELKNDLSDEWARKTYSVGDYCIYKNSMWRCLVDNSVAPSEGSNWTRVTIGSELKRIISMIK